MAIALITDGSDDYLTLASTVTIAAFTPFTIEFLISCGNEESLSRVFGNMGGFTSSCKISSTVLTFNDGADDTFTLTGYVRSDYTKFKIERDAMNRLRCYMNDVQQDTDKFSGGAISFDVIGTINSAAQTRTSIIYQYFTVDSALLLDASSSVTTAGTPVLTDTIGSNDATGVNMPTAALGQPGSAWIDLGGDGVTVTGTTPSFNYSSIAASIDLTGSIDITGQTANYTYSAANGAIDLTGDISITGTTASYNYQSINGVVDLTGEITVLGSTPSQSYSSVSGIIELGAVISVVGLTPNYNYQGITGEVSLNGEILVSGETPSYSYSAIKGFVATGEAQVIGTVTSSFASDVYSSGFKPSTITVNFKS